MEKPLEKGPGSFHHNPIPAADGDIVELFLEHLDNFGLES
jgi:hypothetical protein